MNSACLVEANQKLAAVTHGRIKIITDIEFTILPLIRQTDDIQVTQINARPLQTSSHRSLGLIAACTRGIPS